MIGVLVFLVLIPVAAIPVLAKSNGDTQSKLAPNCSTLRSGQATVVVGGSGVILFSCGTNAALTVGRSDHFRPSFALPAGYTDLRIVSHALGPTACNHGQILDSGQLLDLNGPGNFDYCADYANAPSSGLASFKVAWSK
jgi:hypothetical protein